MRPRERRETSEQELFRSRLDQIIDMKHALVKLGQAIDWRFLEERFGAVYTDKPGQPPLPTRLMAGLAILKHTYDLSDEALCDRWVENPYFQYFCGEEFFQHALVFDRSSLTRWRQRMGEDKLKTLLQESLAVATRTDAMKPSDLARVVIDTTVQRFMGRLGRFTGRRRLRQALHDTRSVDTTSDNCAPGVILTRAGSLDSKPIRQLPRRLFQHFGGTANALHFSSPQAQMCCRDPVLGRIHSAVLVAIFFDIEPTIADNIDKLLLVHRMPSGGFGHLVLEELRV